MTDLRNAPCGRGDEPEDPPGAKVARARLSFSAKKGPGHDEADTAADATPEVRARPSEPKIDFCSSKVNFQKLIFEDFVKFWQ